MKTIDNTLFKLLEKAETKIHKKLGFSTKIQLAFEPLYKYCRKKNK